MSEQQWFDVSKAGLGKQAEEHGKGRLIGELIQNALDEAGVTQIAVTLALVPGRPLADLTVEDDSPEGFRDLSHAYTLFAESYKRDNPEQRGQYNFGEKLVLAVCESASISHHEGHRRLRPDRGPHREAPAEAGAWLGLPGPHQADQGGVPAGLRLPAAPCCCRKNIVVTFNGDRLLPRKPIRTFEASLETLVADEEGVMRPRVRKTQVSIFEPLPGEMPSLYEMGLPVVETGDKWHVNVGQKVPLNRDRDNVKPAYLQAVRVAVLNAAYDLLTTDDEATAGWCKLAGADQRCSDEAIKHLIRLRFGEKVAAPDPSDIEAMKRIPGPGRHHRRRSVERRVGQRQACRCRAACRPDLPHGQAVQRRPERQGRHDHSPKKWTEGMKNIAAYARFLARELMRVSLTVSVVHTTNNFAACYGSGRLDFNLLRLGHKWFEQGATEEVDRLLIHEFGHQYSGDHLSGDYHEALCRLGARLKKLALEKPEAMRRYIGERRK